MILLIISSLFYSLEKVKKLEDRIAGDREVEKYFLKVNSFIITTEDSVSL